MKRLVLCGLAALFLNLTGIAQNRIVGYATSWQGDVNAYRYRCLTHINYSFAIPTATGGLEPLASAQKLSQIVEKGHAVGVKVLIAVGGWDLGDGGGVDTRFVRLAASAATRKTFITNITNMVDQYNLDGVDIDWEYPDGGDAGNFTLLMKELSEALKPKGKLLTAAVAAVGAGANGAAGCIPYVDWLNLMVYDGDGGAGHSPYSYATQSISFWKGKGLTKEKLVLGVPFYSRPGWKSWAQLLGEGADLNADTHNGEHFNGHATMKKKSQLGIAEGSGIMIWEIAHDVSDDRGLLKVIGDIVLPGCDLTDNVADQKASIRRFRAMPNPFSDEVKIEINVSDRDQVLLELYDGTGKRIAILEDNVLNPGDYTYRLSNKGFESGMYFYRISTSKNVFTERIVKL